MGIKILSTQQRATSSSDDITEDSANGFTPSGYHAKGGYSRMLAPQQSSGLFRRVSKMVDPGRAHLITEDLMNSRGRRRNRPGTLILVRNGAAHSPNQDFLGWSDPDVSEIGLREVKHAARLLREAGYDIDVVFTSRLKRALHSTWAILKELDEVWLPVFKSWRLNARCYGSLTNLSKAQVAAQIGPGAVQQWRTDPYATPPSMLTSDPRWPGRLRTYADVVPENIPRGESLSDATRRVKSLWESKIRKELQAGHNVLVVGHGSTLLGLIKHIQGLATGDVFKFRIPRGCPLVFEFDKSLKLKPPTGVKDKDIWGTYLEKPGALEVAMIREDEWKTSIPGYGDTETVAMNSLERSLSKLIAEREFFLGDLDTPVDFDEFDPDFDEFNPSFAPSTESTSSSGSSSSSSTQKGSVLSSHPCLPMLPKGVELPPNFQLPVRQEPTIVMVRHGKTAHNQLGLFTGWEDPPLASEGVEEARAAGRLLKRHGFEFDVVYTSWLSRAIETGWLIMETLDSTWVPVIKSWRLNERMYGDLTGKSKKMVARQYGREQFKLWRRGYKVRPPPVHSFSPSYPGNHKRYVRFMRDVPYSIRESLIRSIALGKPTLSRQFPKTESLQDCMRRTIPYLIHNIQPEAIDQGKRVLIASSENAIRGLLMHLCEIPDDAIASLNIPNGVPIIYDIRQKRAKLLEDGSGIDPLEKYDFGAAAKYLFRADENEDDEECDTESLSADFLEALRIPS